MENKDTNTDYQMFARVGDQKWEIVEITVGFIFFCLRLVFTVFYTGSFQAPPEKNYHYLKCQFPTTIPIWPNSLLNKRSEKRISFPHHQGESGGGRGGLRTMQDITNFSFKMFK